MKDYFTDRRARAREELRAELGAATIGAMAGLPPFHLEGHAAYIADWAKLVKDDPRAFLSAAAKAQAAVDWLIGRARAPDHDPCAGRGKQANGGGAGLAGAAACSGQDSIGEIDARDALASATWPAGGPWQRGLSTAPRKAATLNSRPALRDGATLFDDDPKVGSGWHRRGNLVGGGSNGCLISSRWKAYEGLGRHGRSL